MDETFANKWRSAALGITLTVVVFGAAWAIAFA